MQSGFMGLTVVLAHLNETTPERQMTAPSSARLADERRFAGNLKSRAGVADEAHHMSAATITPSATGGSFNSRPFRPFCRAERFNRPGNETADTARSKDGVQPLFQIVAFIIDIPMG